LILRRVKESVEEYTSLSMRWHVRVRCCRHAAPGLAPYPRSETGVGTRRRAIGRL